MFVWRSDWEELKERVRRLELQQNDWERDGHRISFTDGKVCKGTLETSYDTNSGVIETMLFEQFDGYRVMWLRQQMNTKQPGVRQALIAMGWTPPDSPPTQEVKP